MGLMKLGNVTFTRNPNDANNVIIQKKLSNSYKETYTNVAYFSWGVSHVGKVIELGFKYMPTSQYDSLTTLYEADAEIVFDPADNEGTTYNVRILDLTGKYLMSQTSTAGHRKDITLKLLVMSEVVTP